MNRPINNKYTFLKCFFIFLVFIQVSDCLRNLKVVPTSPTSLKVNFFSNSSANLYKVRIIQRHNMTNSITYRTNTTSLMVSNLKSNVIYDVLVEDFSMNQTSLKTAGPVSARTGPDGCEIKNYFATRKFIVVFLEETAGATEWILRYKTKNTEKSHIYPKDGPTKSYYVHVVTGLESNTAYTFYCRINKILNGSSLPESLSPFRQTTTIATEKPLLFGSVIFSDIQYTPALSASTTSLASIAQRLLNLHRRYSAKTDIFNVTVIEVENDGNSNTRCWYEISLNETTSQGAFDILDDNKNGIMSDVVRANVAGNDFYLFLPERQNQLVASAENHNTAGCLWKDQRSWVFHDQSGGRYEKLLNEGREKDVPSSSQKFDFGNKYLNYITTTSSKPNPIFEFEANTVYAIEHKYLVKTCPSGSETLIYDRLQEAAQTETPESYRYTIIHTTDPPTMKNVCPYVQPLRNGFNIMPVSKAVQYYFHLNNEANKTIGEKMLKEVDLDSSELVQVLFPSLILRNFSYSLLMRMTTRLANGSLASSPTSAFFFHAGPPTSTTLTILTASFSSFTVRWFPVDCAIGYVIAIRDGNISRNITTLTATQHVFGNLSQDEVYFVKIAAFNDFGLSRFSSEKRFPFWSISNVTNSSFLLSWLSDYSIYYITISPSVQANKNTSESSKMFKGLLPGTNYQVKIEVMNSTNSRILLFTTNQITIPSRPAKLSYSANLTSVQISWYSVIGASYYQWTLLSSGTTQTSTTNTTGVTIGNLKAGRFYKFNVFAVNSAGKSSSTELVTQTDKQKPQIKTTAESLTSTSFTVTWQPARDALSYVINATSLNTSSSQIKQTTSSFLLVTELNSGNVYAVTVEANYETGKSGRSNPAFQLLPPGTPQNIKHTTLPLQFGFSIQWEMSFGAKLYTVSAVHHREQSVANITTQTTATSAIFYNVCGKTQYQIYLWASNQVGNSGSNGSKVHQFLSDGYSPADFTLVEVMQDSVLVKWKAVNCANRYQIFVNQTSITNEKLFSDSLEQKVINLNPGSFYFINVAVVYYQNQEGPPTSLYFRTAASNPPSINIINVTNSSIYVTWLDQQAVYQYKLIIENENVNKPEIQTYTYNETEATISNLNPARGYNISIRTTSRVSSSLDLFENTKNSPSIYVVTATSFPENITYQSISQSLFLLSWNPPEGANRYNVRVLITRFETSDETIHNVTENKLNISDETGQGYSYEIRVRAINSQGYPSFESQPLIIPAKLTFFDYIPWWILLIAGGCLLIFTILVIVIIFSKVRNNKKKKSAKYNVEEERRKRHEMKYNVYEDSVKLPEHLGDVIATPIDDETDVVTKHTCFVALEKVLDEKNQAEKSPEE